MKTYLVGGAVRDALLKRPSADRDWVVVGATPAEMRRRGFTEVGRDFPVFLHPRTREHYALARTERKTGAGHAAFACDSSPTTTLAEDLARRDLTINAIAQAEDGTLIDPYGGQADLTARRLRHVSPAFAEDPLRVFRVARFAAVLPGFRVSDETLALMRRMAPELPALAGERVWQELARAMAAPCPVRFFEVMQALDGGHWLADLDLAGAAALLGSRTFPDAETGLAALGWLHPAETIGAIFQRLRAASLLRQAAMAVADHGRTLAADDVSPETLLEAVQHIGAFRQGALAALVLASVEVCASVDLAPLRALIDALRRERVCAEGIDGRAYGRALRAQRLACIESALPLAARGSPDG